MHQTAPKMNCNEKDSMHHPLKMFPFQKKKAMHCPWEEEEGGMTIKCSDSSTSSPLRGKNAIKEIECTNSSPLALFSKPEGKGREIKIKNKKTPSK